MCIEKYKDRTLVMLEYDVGKDHIELVQLLVCVKVQEPMYVAQVSKTQKNTKLIGQGSSI